MTAEGFDKRPATWRSIVKQWPPWLKVIAPAAVVVVVAVLAAVAFGGGPSRDDIAQRDLRHAGRLCTQYARDHGIDESTVSYGPGRAGDLKVLGKQFHVDISPWDRYPNDHFIAQCSFISTEVPTLDDSTPTTRCANGDIVVLQSPELPPSVLVDDERHTSPDPFAGLPSLIKPCDGLGKR